jgi:hypothetical protein
MDIREIRWGSMNWNDLAQNMDKWRILVKTIINLNFHKMLEIS